jgi:hypothetical protein
MGAAARALEDLGGGWGLPSSNGGGRSWIRAAPGRIWWPAWKGACLPCVWCRMGQRAATMEDGDLRLPWAVASFGLGRR